jgi:tetratricopeptide (TPR) repeat protein
MTTMNKTSFFISYAAADRSWAAWIAWALETTGYSTFVDARDIEYGQSFVHQVRQALAHCDQMIMLLTPRYLMSELTAAELSAAFARDPTGGRGLLLPVRVEKCDPGDRIGGMGFVDLVGLDEASARNRLLRHIERAHAKPSSPPLFPARAWEPRVTPPFPESEPKIWNLPPRLKFFTDREDLLARIRERFAVEPTSGTKIQVLTGLGGIGKSALAIEYAYRFRSDYRVGWIITSDSPDSFASGVAGLARAIGLPEPELRYEGSLLESLRRWLETNGPWLLIFDDADEPEVLRPLLPLSANGHVLVTSRNLQWSDIAQRIEVDVLPRAASIFLLRERTKDDDIAIADKVAAILGDLPLGLELAGTYCAQTGTSLADYAEKLERGYSDAESGYGSVKRNITASTDLWLSKLENDFPTATELINLLSFFADTAIDPDLIASNAEALSEPLRSVVRDKRVFGDAIIQLERTSLLRREGTNLIMHPFAQLVIRERMIESRRREVAKAAVALVDLALPEFPFGAWDAEVAATHNRLDEHALAVAGHAEASGVSLEAVARLFAKFGSNRFMRNDFVGARSAFQRAIAIDERVLGPEHPQTSADLNNLGMTLRSLGDLTGARATFERALTIDEKVLGPDHSQVAAGLSNLGLVLRALGDLTGARAIFERALAIDERKLGPEHPQTAADLSNLGLVLVDLGEYIDARVVFERSLSIEERVLGPEHPNVAMRLRNLGLVLGKLSDVAGAMAAFEQARGIADRAFGPCHPLIAQLLRDIAWAHWQSGDSESGIASLSRSISLSQNMGDQHQTAESEHFLARMLEASGEVSRSEEAYIQTLGNYEALGDQFNVSEILYQISKFYQRHGRATDAVVTLSKSVQILVRLNIDVPSSHIELGRDICAAIGVDTFFATVDTSADDVTRDAVSLIFSQMSSKAEDHDVSN